MSEMHVHLSLFPLGRVLVVDPDLSQNGDVHHHLEQPADHELRGSFAHVKVGGFENIATSPHEYHLEAKIPLLVLKKSIILVLKTVRIVLTVAEKAPIAQLLFIQRLRD